ncbi:helix-turn-helix domain-containing protein [Deminuibacter soli]|uniref:XRE family transcriptional regulator n=1 Tax=Deminuibacter soli TaxID=2291815 RepID=A0A3E1NGI3_9BACT|nr:helix-turn-helix transcriptional regulator [Deminuibacter soli]RFM26997.1 XRE family transcriptional regulator [Deminuibacter soli]
MTNTDMPNKVHEGRNIKRFREMLGIKQEGLAFELGEDWNQKKVSLLEQKETIEVDILEQVAKILKVTPEAIQKFNEDYAVQIISNTFNDQSVLNGYNFQPTFNPIDKIVQLYNEKVELYERMLKEKNEMIDRLSDLKKG